MQHERMRTYSLQSEQARIRFVQLALQRESRTAQTPALETLGGIVWRRYALSASIYDLDDDDSLCILFNDHFISLEYHTTHTCTLSYHHRFVYYLYLRFMLRLVLFFR